MKVITIIKSPIALMISFCLIIISGEQTGGFYIIYLIMGLIKASSMHSILGLAGILLLFAGITSSYSKKIFLASLFKCIAVLMMIFSLILFFYNDSRQYNIATFHQIIPLATVVLFGILSLIFLLFNVRELVNNVQRKKIDILA